MGREKKNCEYFTEEAKNSLISNAPTFPKELCYPCTCALLKTCFAFIYIRIVQVHVLLIIHEFFEGWRKFLAISGAFREMERGMLDTCKQEIFITEEDDADEEQRLVISDDKHTDSPSSSAVSAAHY